MSKVPFLLFAFLVLVKANLIGQTPEKFVGKWQDLRIENFFFQLELRQDGTFEWNESFELGSSSAKGNWQASGDTIYLSDFRKPIRILDVQEREVPEQPGSLIDVDIALFDMLTWIRPSTRQLFYLNEDCETHRWTDSTERYHHPGPVTSIDFLHDRYKVKKPRANHFTVLLSGFLLPVSPPPFHYDCWVLVDGKLRPIECGKPAKYLELERK